MCSQQTSTNSNLKTTTSYSPTTTNSKHDITQQFSGERQTATISISDFAHKIKTITNTKMHEMHLDIVIITYRCTTYPFSPVPRNTSLENTEPKFGTGNARSSKEGHETSAKASESLPFECIIYNIRVYPISAAQHMPKNFIGMTMARFQQTEEIAMKNRQVNWLKMRVGLV